VLSAHAKQLAMPCTAGTLKICQNAPSKKVHVAPGSLHMRLKIHFLGDLRKQRLNANQCSNPCTASWSTHSHNSLYIVVFAALARRLLVASCPQAALSSSPLVVRTVHMRPESRRRR